jgi:murein L,D-transpeptidase YafK
MATSLTRTFAVSLLFGIAASACSRSGAEDAKPAASPAPQASVKPDAKKKFYSAILVDKATNTLELADLQDGEYVTLKKLHATLGKVKGDKEQEGDQKTPEGIYTFNQILKPPSLPAKYGTMAFVVNYPNDYDRIAGRTGYGIMLHATNTPDRLNQDYDSEGCVVCKNEELAEMASSIRLGLTPILVFQKLSDEYRRPGKDPEIRSFFETWIKAWETRDLATYIEHYHSDFSAQGKDRDAWKAYKEQLNKRYTDISIGPEDVLYYRHPKYWMITFTQNYRSKVKGGGWGHRSRGTKILYVAEEAGKPKIITETYTQLMW